ncbi:hypothetical protein HAX54_026534 [Datura stramonium]|uniref:Uncharacterized protein n=1 Tax=Datura stramonium TaxID=4076 RepID=A0ABS8S7Y7_DATST|nr:hypothetical protein [Datura stramonium]
MPEPEGPTATEGMLETNLEAELSGDDVDGEDVEMPHDKLELSDSVSGARQAESLRKKSSMELLKDITMCEPNALVTDECMAAIEAFETPSA